jgi:hypothetical protein
MSEFLLVIGQTAILRELGRKWEKEKVKKENID